jgi:hypothetical protein
MGIILLPKHNFVAKTREGKYQRRRDKDKRKRGKGTRHHISASNANKWSSVTAASIT